MAVVFARRNALQASLAALLLGMLAFQIIVITGRGIATQYRPLGLVIRRQAAPQDQIVLYQHYTQGIPFYARRRVDKVLNWVGELHYAQRDPANASRFGDERDIRALPLQDRDVFVTFRKFEAPFIFSVTGDPPRGKAAFGNWMLAAY